MQPLSGMLGGKLKRIPGSAGVLSAGMEARIVREDGTEADFNEAGELWLRGDNVSMGYWNNTKATTETFVDGWLRTGDQFRIDEKENFWCVSQIFSIFAQHMGLTRTFLGTIGLLIVLRLVNSFGSMYQFIRRLMIFLSIIGYAESFGCASIPSGNRELPPRSS